MGTSIYTKRIKGKKRIGKKNRDWVTFVISRSEIRLYLCWQLNIRTLIYTRLTK